jgi:hypothetical protein
VKFLVLKISNETFPLKNQTHVSTNIYMQGVELQLDNNVEKIALFVVIM